MRSQSRKNLRNTALGLALMATTVWPAVPSQGKDPLAENGFQHFYNLEYEEEIATFRLDISRQPSEPAIYNHLAQAVLYRALYQSGQLEDSLISGEDLLLSLIRQPKLPMSAADEHEFSVAIQTASDLAETRLRSNPNDTASLYARGVSYGLRANYKFLVQKAWLSAMRDSGAARRLHNRVLEINPANADAMLMQGVNDYVVASLPSGFRFLGAAVGIRGDKERGLRTLAEVARRGTDSRVDAQILLATLYRHEKQCASAIRLLDDVQAHFPRNYLIRLAQVYTAIDAGDTAGATQSLRAMEDLSRRAAPGYRDVQPAKLLFAQGLIELRSGELEQAIAVFSGLARNDQGRPATTRFRAFVRLGQAYDLHGDRQLAMQVYQTVVASAPNTRCSRESQKYLSRPYRVNDGD